MEALPDPSATAPDQLCTVGGHVIAFVGLSIVPDLGDPASLLFQQAAAVGLSHECVLRELVSLAALRAGAPQLPPAALQAAPEAQPVLDPDPYLDEIREIVEFDLGIVDACLQAAARRGWPGVMAGMGDDEEEGEEGERAETEGGGAGAAAAASSGAAEGAAEAEAAAAVAEARWQAAQAQPLPNAYESITQGEDLGGEVAVSAGTEGGAWLEDPAAAAAAADSWAASDAPGGSQPPPSRQPVWVLFGGDGPERQQSLAGGLHAFLSLRSDAVYEAEAFMLEPTHCGPKEEERRRELLDVSAWRQILLLLLAAWLAGWLRKGWPGCWDVCCGILLLLLLLGSSARPHTLRPQHTLLHPPRPALAALAPHPHPPSSTPHSPLPPLLQRRLDLMKLGLDEAGMAHEYPHLDLTRIHNPPPSGLWCVGGGPRLIQPLEACWVFNRAADCWRLDGCCLQLPVPLPEPVFVAPAARLLALGSCFPPPPSPLHCAS